MSEQFAPATGGLALVDPSTSAGRATLLLVVALALLAALFALRPELWRRIFFTRIDPRPAGLLRIAFGAAVLWNWIAFLPYARVLFTDEGLWLTEMARRDYGRRLAFLWDAERGFEHWWHVFPALWGNFSVLHFRSDPPFVFAIYAALLVALAFMLLGLWTRTATVVSWLLMAQLYGYSNIYYTSGDCVIRTVMFLGVFTRWGEAYSLDSWRRRRRAIRDGAAGPPPLVRIPAWPQRLMMLQLAIIYCATGLLKTGATWKNGTALYYAMNLDSFYRVPATGFVTFLQYIGLLGLLTRAVRWWEMLFPLALVGAALAGYERDRANGRWIAVRSWRRIGSWLVAGAFWIVCAYVAGLAPLVVVLPALAVGSYLALRARWPRASAFVRHWLLGKRLWLGFGLGLHLGIYLAMNVGTFSEPMIAAYLPWLSGAEIAAFWKRAGAVLQTSQRTSRSPTP